MNNNASLIERCKYVAQSVKENKVMLTGIGLIGVKTLYGGLKSIGIPKDVLTHFLPNFNAINVMGIPVGGVVGKFLATILVGTLIAEGIKVYTEIQKTPEKAIYIIVREGVILLAVAGVLYVISSTMGGVLVNSFII